MHASREYLVMFSRFLPPSTPLVAKCIGTPLTKVPPFCNPTPPCGKVLGYPVLLYEELWYTHHSPWRARGNGWGATPNEKRVAVRFRQLSACGFYLFRCGDGTVTDPPGPDDQFARAVLNHQCALLAR